MRRILLGAVLVVVPYLPAAEAAFMTGKMLLAHCRNETDVYDQAFCLAYIVAIADVLWAGNSVQGHSACPPDQIAQGQVQDIAVPWLEAYPQYLHFGANSLVAAALADAFPCRT